MLTNLGALDRAKQLAVVEQFTDIVAGAAGRPELKERTWVLLTEAPDGGWGLWGHAHTNAELVAAARAEAARLDGGGDGCAPSFDLHLIVLPGGGYETYAENEAEPVVEWLTELGLTANVLRCPLPAQTGLADDPTRLAALTESASAVKVARSSRNCRAFSP